MEILHAVLGFLGHLALEILALLAVVLAVAAFWTAFGLVVAGIGAVLKLVSGRLAERRSVPAAEPSFSLALLVRFDEWSGQFRPRVQVRGQGVLNRAWIRLDLVDGKGALRLVRRKRLAQTAIGAELPLGEFEPPEGATAEDVLGWHWDVVIEDKEGERARWREHPRPVEYLNAEAELA